MSLGPPAALSLSPTDGILLNNLFALSRNIFAVANHAQLPIHEALNWLNQPHIQAAIDSINKLETDEHKSAALATLRHLHTTSEDPVERRRAANQSLQALRPQQPPRAATQRAATTATPDATTTSPAYSTQEQPPRSGLPRSPSGGAIPAPAGMEGVHPESPPRSGAPSSAPSSPSRFAASSLSDDLDDDDDALEAAEDAELDAEFAHIPTDELCKLALAALEDLRACGVLPPAQPSGP